MVIEASNDGIWDLNLVTGESYFSPRYSEMLGYSSDEIQNSQSRWNELLHPDDRSTAKIQMDDLIENKIPILNHSYRMKMKDGKWKWINLRGKIVEYKQDGTPSRISGTQTDIDELMEMQCKLEESKNRYKTLTNATFEGIEISSSGIIMDCNKTLCDMMKCSIDEIIGKPFMDFVAEESKEFVTGKVKEGKNEDSFKYHAVKKDGVVFPVEIRSRKIEAGGKKIRVTAIRDISLQIKAEEEILRREETLQNIIDSAPFGAHTYKVNEKGELIFTSFNRYAEEVLNLDHKKLIGKTIESAFPTLAMTQVPKVYQKGSARRNSV